MQKFSVLFLISFFNLTLAFGDVKANCSNENTFLKINEVRVDKNGDHIAEIFMNFKDLNRILNLPEVVLRKYSLGYYVRETNGAATIVLRFSDVVEDQKSEPQREVSISVKLDGKKIREQIKLKCEK
jgi:hypothetical protein